MKRVFSGKALEHDKKLLKEMKKKREGLKQRYRKEMREYCDWDWRKRKKIKDPKYQTEYQSMSLVLFCVHILQSIPYIKSLTTFIIIFNFFINQT